MASNLVIEVSDDLLQSLERGGTVTVRIVPGGNGNGSVPAARAGQATRYRAGTHPARLIEWATKRGKEFGTDEVVKALGVNRAHASMILTKLAGDGGPVQRVARGVYRVEGGAAPAPSRPRRKKGKKKATAKRRTGRKKRATKKAPTRRS